MGDEQNMLKRPMHFHSREWKQLKSNAGEFRNRIVGNKERTENTGAESYETKKERKEGIGGDEQWKGSKSESTISHLNYFLSKLSILN